MTINSILAYINKAYLLYLLAIIKKPYKIIRITQLNYGAH